MHELDRKKSIWLWPPKPRNLKDDNKKEVMPCMEKTNQTKELFLIEYDCNKLKIWNPWTGFQHQPISPSKILLEFETTAILTLRQSDRLLIKLHSHQVQVGARKRDNKTNNRKKHPTASKALINNEIHSRIL